MPYHDFLSLSEASLHQVTVADHTFTATVRAVHNESTLLGFLDIDILLTNLAKYRSAAFNFYHILLPLTIYPAKKLMKARVIAKEKTPMGTSPLVAAVLLPNNVRPMA